MARCYPFALFTTQQVRALHDQTGLEALATLHTHLDQLTKRCWKRLDDSMEAVLHFTFVLCGVEAFCILLRYHAVGGAEWSDQLPCELNGLAKLVGKVVKRVLEERDWREDVLPVIRQAQQQSILIFYMLNASRSADLSALDTAMRLYFKNRVAGLIGMLDDVSWAACSASVLVLVDGTVQLRTQVLSFSHH